MPWPSGNARLPNGALSLRMESVHIYLRRLCLAALLAAGCLVGGGVTAAAVPESTSWLYRAWQTEDGLPDNDITGVAQTDDGFLWVASKGGLLRFDGVEFTPLSLIELPGVPSRAVRAMFRDSQSRLWLGMERGPVLCIAPDQVHTYSSANGLLAQRVLGMAEDHEGATWIAYALEVRRILKGKVSRPELPPELQAGGVVAVATDAKHELWLGKGAWLSVFRNGALQPVLQLKNPPAGIFPGAKSGLWICSGGSGGRLFKFEEGHDLEDHGEWPGRSAPLALFEDRTGALWFGTAADGLFRLEGRRLERVPMSHQEVTCLTEDREGNLWAATTGGGVNLIRLRAVQLIGRDAGLPFGSVQSVCEDKQGKLWAVSQAGDLTRGREGDWEVMSVATNWPGGRATCVAADREGGVWVGTLDNGVAHYAEGRWRTWGQADGLGGNSARSLLVSADGDVWVGMSGPDRLMRIRDGQASEIQKPGRIGAIRAMAETPDGTVWVGTSEGQLLRVEGSSLTYEPAIRERFTLSIRSLHATPDGSLWIGYAGDGLGRLKGGIHKRVTTAVGLMDNFISQIQGDGLDSLWLVGNRGLSRVQLSQVEAVMDGRTERVRSRIYGRSDGLPGLQPSRDHSPVSCRTSDGRLWFSTRSGLLSVIPDKIVDNLDPPPVRLERVSVDDQPVALFGAIALLRNPPGSNVLDLRTSNSKLHVGPDHSKLEFEFVGLSYTSPENVQFRYRLKGFDRKWIEAGSERHATYPHLPGGNYEFQVLACNNAGVWNETGAVLSMVVAPYFWETWWFKISASLTVLLGAGGTVFFFARRRYHLKLSRIEARRALEQERSRIAKDIHDDLGASLTRITLLSQSARGSGEDSSGAAVESLEEIHSTARQLTRSMEEVVWAVNPEHDTFDGLANYISNYAQSFLRVAGVRCRLEMPMQLPAHPLSAEIRHNLFLAFKEALNNIVKHSGATEVRISLFPEATAFRLLVEDNGRGLPQANGGAVVPPRDETWPRNGNGLPNMRNRLQDIGGTCTVESSPGGGTQIMFAVPLKKNRALP